jgi:hypothetical protein
MHTHAMIKAQLSSPLSRGCIPPHRMDVITDEQLTEVNQLLRQALKNDHAYVRVDRHPPSLDPTISYKYNLVVDLGISGPLHEEFVYGIVHDQMFENLTYMTDIYPDLECTYKYTMVPSNHLHIFTNLPAALFYTDTRNSLYACLKKYLSPNQLATDDAAEVFYNDLLCNNIISREAYPTYRIKNKGIMPGVILAGSPNIFVKEYLENDDIGSNELLDHALFAVAKSCGIKAPSVRLVKTPNYSYLLSTDMGVQNPKYPHKSYTHVDLEDFQKAPSNYLDEKSATAHQGRTSNGLFTQNIAFDLLNLARLCLGIVIFDLADIQKSNCGLVISDNNGVLKAKLALLDCVVDQNPTLTDDSIHTTSIKKYMTRRVRKIHADEAVGLLLAAIAKMDVNHFIKALTKIETNLSRACAEIQDQLKNVTSGKAQETRVAMNKWQQNLLVMLRLAQGQQVSEPSQAKKPRAS